MLTQYSYIYFSPHLDDVALSCGGQIAQRTAAGETVLIVTMTAGNAPTDQLPPFARSHHQAWALGNDAVAARRAEDVLACERLGADWIHWDVRDAIYRLDPLTGAVLYAGDETLFGAVHQAELPLIERLARQMRELPVADQVVVPLTVGNHVDHQLVRLSAEKAYTAQLHYYEDYPYAHWHGLGDKVGNGWQSEVIRFGEQYLAQKLNAVAAYESQIEHLFESLDDMHSKITAYAEQIGGEQLWRFKNL